MLIERDRRDREAFSDRENRGSWFLFNACLSEQMQVVLWSCILLFFMMAYIKWRMVGPEKFSWGRVLPSKRELDGFFAA